MHPLVQRYHDLVPDFSLVKSIRPAIRVNTLKTTDDKLVRTLEAKGVRLEKIPFLSHGYWYESKFSLGATPEYLQGHYFLHEAASQVPTEVLEPKPGETVLDMACAPGAKLTQMAAMMQNKGVLIGLDTNEKRLMATRNNMARLGVENAILYLLDARNAKSFKVTFDRILLDAPCSGNYVVEKDYFEKRKLADFQNRAALQKALLRSAFDVLKKGGTIVYATCTLEPEEDEEVMDWAVEELGAKIEPVTISVGDPGLMDVFGRIPHPSVAGCRRFWPHRTGTQGFFVGKMRKQP